LLEKIFLPFLLLEILWGICDFLEKTENYKSPQEIGGFFAHQTIRISKKISKSEKFLRFVF